MAGQPARRHRDEAESIAGSPFRFRSATDRDRIVERIAWALAESDQPPKSDDDCGHHSWAGLMALLDEHWPEDVFPTLEDDVRRDAGARIVSLLRWVDRLRGVDRG